MRWKTQNLSVPFLYKTSIPLENISIMQFMCEAYMDSKIKITNYNISKTSNSFFFGTICATNKHNTRIEIIEIFHTVTKLPLYEALFIRFSFHMSCKFW